MILRKIWFLLAKEDEDEYGGAEEKPVVVRTSLMDLLAETVGSAYAMEEDQDGDDEDEDDDSRSEEYNNCSISMVRHKGAAL